MMLLLNRLTNVRELNRILFVVFQEQRTSTNRKEILNGTTERLKA
jgi:hypothetical protein